MKQKVCFISECPLTAVTLSGRIHEGFYPDQQIILVNKATRRYCSKIVQRVVDSDDGNCILDLYL